MPLHSEIPGSPLSLPIRMEAKRRKSRAGIAALVLGIIFLALGIYGFAIGGAELLGLWGLVFGIGASGAGITILVKASKTR